ncbi:4-hydroxybenzoate octaprenyltransferase [Methylopila jiangsuensis]|uniref:4-hydroxybenzoate octaprenyltransferase n=1 Tax=Methylopila jiangsuensis TaxID=586230 RepID=A0A9W6N522_9HYPH|nr:4-hydroxybenzoate octaprenyltransferase [Methylopila jiangsuensis]MDR6284794.1 4-hydroxybenzoate polyprenyltransferase [Methylopila jiangsuensis]GLK77816.1 4-hydroxybenzoate octaprenyltransferase [Methylopila jiangsuensis]
MTAPTPGSVADATPRNWVDERAPAAWRPYLRLARADRPVGSWLLFWPCAWSVALAAVAGGFAPNLWHIALFAVGAVAMRGAGCTYNDLVDRDIDAQVARTRSRPLPSGQVTARAAAVFLAAQILIGLAVLLALPPFAILVGACSVLPVALYPFMKRITWWPQAMLGVCFGWGALMGWAAAFGRLDAAPLALHAAAFVWIIGYDTIYAHQDKEDDALVGVGSTALLFGARTRPIVATLYAAAALLIGVAILLAGGGWLSYAGLAGFAAHCAWQIARLDISNPALCLTLFKSNREAGALLFAGLALDAITRL